MTGDLINDWFNLSAAEYNHLLAQVRLARNALEVAANQRSWEHVEKVQDLLDEASEGFRMDREVRLGDGDEQ